MRNYTHPIIASTIRRKCRNKKFERPFDANRKRSFPTQKTRAFFGGKSLYPLKIGLYHFFYKLFGFKTSFTLRRNIQIDANSFPVIPGILHVYSEHYTLWVNGQV